MRVEDTGTEPPAQPGHWFQADPLWFKRAVFYEIHLRGFYDGNGDGSGDLRGLTEKLEYLKWLGIDCIWLLPMYPSPLKDGGYDVADFLSVHPDYGVVDDFVRFVDQAHQLGMRVIADFVMNHTSSDHPWFQESRSSPDSPKRDWYVWSDTDQLYTGARIIFTDTETSNWTWDPVAGAYYWHRFFHHQPDLNYDNPEVGEAMLSALRFWLDLGLDGFRLDAVPYLYERDGTNCENLAETHAFLRRVRSHIDESHPDTVLLAEANQWPADVVEYFGDGDECHMAFHFPVMPRMFMALRREEARPIYEILAQTPAIPDNCQWGLFLRNHDELTLEMVTDEERDYMYAEYAKDPRMRINVGIRRRLAPLLDNGRDEIELVHAILFSLPGSPVLYYGDEIGMGDNVHLGDRDGVRTPMHWTGDRNAGFSRADFAQLYLPPLMDPVTGYAGGQRRGPAAHADLAAALAAPLHRPAQGASRVRSRHVRAALARQPARLRPRAPLRGGHRAVRAQPRPQCPGGHARPLRVRGRHPRGAPRRCGLPRRHARAATCSRSAGAASTGSSCGGPMLDLTRLPEAELSAFVARQPWFRAHRSEGAAMRVVEATYVHTVAPLLAIALVEVATERGLNEIYQLPIGLRPEGEASAAAAIATLDGWTAYDALSDPELAGALVDLVRDAGSVQTDVSTIDFQPVRGPRHGPGAGFGLAPGDRRGPPQHVGRDRRGAGAEGLPAALRGRQPGGRAAALPGRARLREHARAARLLRALRPPDRLDARHRHALRAGRARRLVVRALVAGGRFRARLRARVARLRFRALPGGARAARRGHGGDARPAGLRLERSELRRRGAECSNRSPSWRPRSTRRSRPSSRTCPRARCWRRSPAAARRCASACACSRA